jgi:hypothetical protein
LFKNRRKNNKLWEENQNYSLEFLKGLKFLIKNNGCEKHVMKGSLFSTFALIKNYKVKIQKRDFFQGLVIYHYLVND